MSPPVFVLASASPARLQTLQAAGLRPEVIISGVDESTVELTTPEEVSGTLARMKAEATVAMLRERAPERAALVLGCDSVLSFDGAIMGKPADDTIAAERWRRMRGRSGVLYTGHCLIDMATGRTAEEVTGTVVHFGDITDEELDAYVATGEPRYVAGGFTIDGLGGWFVDRLEGDHGTVIGVSLPALRRLLRAQDASLAAYLAPLAP